MSSLEPNGPRWEPMTKLEVQADWPEVLRDGPAVGRRTRHASAKLARCTTAPTCRMAPRCNKMGRAMD